MAVGVYSPIVRGGMDVVLRVKFKGLGLFAEPVLIDIRGLF